MLIRESNSIKSSPSISGYRFIPHKSACKDPCDSNSFSMSACSSALIPRIPFLISTTAFIMSPKNPGNNFFRSSRVIDCDIISIVIVSIFSECKSTTFFGTGQISVKVWLKNRCPPVRPYIINRPELMWQLGATEFFEVLRRLAYLVSPGFGAGFWAAAGVAMEARMSVSAWMFFMR